ncbi:hypothetical protein NEOLI_003820 [Neolecta irregularis DAH-3]|uniref:Uncharacterized protein n=1 Tax=Neolecta irregularis (strain DAH-3) TaxID=1198029 RepID=A0A1U7LRN6_NEOID|nr:hypothetical protein NEOLI_003820 [Neolecta irregularis DAH-3]|eukprot:OLL25181.1 hypothetical protein NEOLI_003820 [Neolecta irregularis DAH-3]
MPPPNKGKPAFIEIPTLALASEASSELLGKSSSAFSSLFRWPQTHRHQSSQASEQNFPSAADADVNKVAALETELRSVSSDLARLIRREMDLEDMISQLQDDVDLALNGGKPQKRHYRSSDYFSDVGSGSPGKGYGASRPSLEEKQTQLERRIQELDISSIHASDYEETPKLQALLEDMRQKYAEDRSVKQGLEDIIAMNKLQLDALQDERDQLQQDVVPSLKERLATLEHAAEHLRNEKERLTSHLQNTEELLQKKSDQMAKLCLEIEHLKVSAPKAAAPLLDTTERIKEIETQRDALHQSLRALRERQTFESKKSASKIQALERELQKLRPSSDRNRLFHSLNANPNLEDDTKRRLVSTKPP